MKWDNYSLHYYSPLFLTPLFRCGHCKRFAPTYEKAAKILKREDPPIILAKVDAAHETELGEEFGITGYPTLKIFKRGRALEYKGQRQREYGTEEFIFINF